MSLRGKSTLFSNSGRIRSGKVRSGIARSGKNRSTVVSVVKESGVTLERIVRLTGIVETNGHTIGTGYRGLYPLISLLSHNCIANSRQSMLKEWPYTATCRLVLLLIKSNKKVIVHFNNCQKQLKNKNPKRTKKFQKYYLDVCG